MLSDKMINKRLFVLMLLIFMMLIIPASFASDNISDVNTISLNQSSDISQITIDDSGSLDGIENSTDGNSLSVVYVNAEGDDDGDGSQAKPFKTINQGLSALADNGTLMLEGTFKGIGNTNLTVNNTITMVGTNNAVIDGENNNWLLNVKNGISIYNLTFTNAYSIINSGAAISATTGTITLANVTFSNNYAFKKGSNRLFGGAIYNEEGSVVVGDNTKFINNTAENYGGAIYAKSGNILISGNDVLFDSNKGYHAGAIYGLYINITGNNIKFVNNNATSSGGSGGAIYAAKDVNVLSNGVIFDSNDANSGGAIYTSSYARVYIYANNTIFTNNNARSSYGGAVYGYYGITIVGNNNKFINNAAKSGGALYVSSGSANVAGNNNLFENNKVTGTSYIYGGGAVKANSIYVSGDNTKFINNSAVYGGAISASSSSSSNIISISGKNTQFINNTASTSGGAIYSKAKLAISNTVFDGNNGKDSAIYLSAAGNINYCVFTGNIGTYTITASTSASNNFDNNWWGNSTPDFTKLININSPSSYATLNLTVANSILEQGESTVLDINAYWNGTTSQDNIGNIPFDKVYLNTTGGSIKETEGNLVDGKFSTEFVSNTIGNFTITSKLGDEVQTVNITVKGPSGTVLYVSKTGNDDNDGLTRVNPLLTINKAIEIAKNNKNITKIMVNDGVYDTSELNVALALAIVGQSQNGTILKGNGKQIFVFTSDAKVNLTSLTLRNAAGNFGGAISNNGTLIITDCAFINNTALTNAGAIDNGGTLTVISSLFANNTASNDAGAISSTSSVSLTINNSTFINNTATRNGGAIKVQRSQATITNSIFDSNVALGDSGKSYGGAVYGWGANVSIYNSTLTNNNIKSNGKGGAIFAGGADNTFKASGLTITNNSAVTAGAVYFEEIGGSLTNSIILDNAGNYAVDGSGSATVNNNWWGNTNTNTTFNTNLVNGISTPTEWVILNVSASAKDIYVKDNVDVTIDLSKTQLGNTVNIPGSFLVTITTNTGKVNTTTANLVNGTATVKYTAVSDGNDTLFVDLDGVKTSVDFNISAIPHIIYVDAVNGNDTNGGNSWETAIKTIKHALTLLDEDKDTIYLANGTYNENSLEITKSVSIVGFGNVTIDANSLGRIFAVTTDDLDVGFKNINFVNAKATGFNCGGAIYFSSSYKAINSTASIDNCTFKNSYSAAFGGAIHNVGYKLTINNTVFDNNSAKYSGAVCIMGGENTVLNSVFVNNTIDKTGDQKASSRYGGAIRVQSGNATILNCVFVGNDADGGSAIYEAQLANKLTVNYCIFENYPANATVIGTQNISGVKIVDANYNYFGTNNNPANLTDGYVNTTYWTVLTVTPDTDEVIVGETAKLNIDFTKFTDGTNNYTLKEAMPTLTVTLTPIIGNVAPDTVVCENGVASVNYTSSIAGDEVISIKAPYYVGDVKFNVASEASHIIYVDAVNGKDEYSGSTWNNAVKTIKHALTLVTSDKNIIYLANGTYNENSLEITKSVSIVGFSNATIDAASAGRIFLVATSGLDVGFKNINFVNTTTEISNHGGAICFANGFKAVNGTASVDNCTFINCHSSGYGGAIYNTNYKLTVNNSVFIKNAALFSGAICVIGEETTVLNSLFVNNTIDGKNARLGGAIRVQSGKATVLNCVFMGNDGDAGSAIYAMSSATGLVVNYCIFEGYPTNATVIENSNNKLTVDANYNYFGTNNNPANLTSGVNTTYWTILSITPDEDEIIAGETVKLNIDFTKFTDGINNYTLSKAMPNLSVTLTPVIGNVAPDTVVCENGVASVNYTSSIAGDEVISIKAPYYVGDVKFNVLNNEINVIYVSPSGDDSNKGTSDSPLKTLAAAIAKNHELGGNKTICLLDGTYSASALNINDDVIIAGKNNGKVIINGESKDYIINSSAKLTIMNVTFAKAKKAIINNGELNIKTSAFSNNDIGISSTAGNVTIDNSKFISNNKYGICVENTTLSLNNNIMKDNAANINITSGSIVSKMQVVFLNNSTLRVLGNESFVIGATICDDVGNIISGGNISFTANGVVVGSGNIVNGTANCTINSMDDGTYTISGTTSLGTNLIVKTGTLNVYSAHWFIGDVGYETLADAVEAANNGDVIEGLPGVYKYTKPVEIVKNITIKNRGQGEVILDGSLNTDNYIVYQIGIEYINNILRIPYGNATVDLYNLIFTNVNNQGHGGAIYNHGNLSIYNCTFVNNTVVGDPDYEYNYGGAGVFSYNAHLVIRDSYFENNSGFEGGAIYAAADPDVISTADINNTIFKNNTAVTVTEGGGAIYSGNYLKLLVNNTRFIGNSAPSKHSQYIAGGIGGAIYIRMSSGSLIINSEFVNNSAFYWGGAIKSYSAIFDVTNCNFTGNYAGSSGGAFHFAGTGSSVAVAESTINNCTFNNNDAGSTISAGGSTYRGGAICIEGGAKVYNSVFNENTAIDGGAIFTGYTQSDIANCTFIANTAVKGGAVENYWGTVNVTGSYFNRNMATYGGAIANYQYSNHVNLLNNTYVENSAAYGGAIYSSKNLYVAPTNILYSEFVNNSASAYGNELCINGNATVNYNAFVNSVLGNIEDVYVNSTSVDYVSLENNWWGTSNPNWDEILSDTNVSAPKAYAVLNATLNESGNDTYDLIVNMYWNGTISQANIANIPARLVKLNATGGSFSVDEGKFANGVFKSLFFTGDDKNYIIGVKVDNELIKLNLTVFKPTSVNVTINKGDDPRDNIISVVVTPDKATGNVTIDIDGKKSVVNLTDGKASIILSNLTTGEHTLTVTYNGDQNYDSSNITVKFNETFSPIVDLTVPDLEKYFGGLEKLEAILKDNLGNPIANGTIIFTINGRDTIKYTNENGSAFININLVPGEYNASVKFNGTDLYNPMAVNSTVVVKSTTIGHDIVKMFRNSTQYTALFLDSEGNPLVNTTVQFNINGVLYNRTTNTKGIATLNIQLLPNNYTITNYNPVTGEENSNKVVVKSLIVDNKNLTKYYLNGSQYTIKVFGKDGNVAAYQEVTFNINGVFYKRVTDGNGMVSLNINLRPGDYVVTAEYEGCSVSNNIKVLPTLITKDLDMSCCDGSKFTAQTLDGQGNPLANQNIKFNINGVFYYKTTGSNGIAELNINLNPGKYIITSIWNDYQVGNHITIK